MIKKKGRGGKQKRREKKRKNKNVRASEQSTVAGLVDFMLERERIRVRRQDGLPKAAWTTNAILQKYRFTNVHRVHDKATVAIQACLSSIPSSIPLSCLVFNAALQREFGTPEFAAVAGFATDWTDSTKDRIVEKAMENARKGIHNYTDAYSPQRSGHALETNEGRWGSREKHLEQLEKCYRKTCSRLDLFWASAEDIAQTALKSKSWGSTVGAVRKVHGWNGTGFKAGQRVKA